MPLEWERRPEESGRAYSAFVLYRDLGPTRSLAAAYAASRHPGGGVAKKAASHWEEWSSAYDWVERAEAYDAHLEARRRAEREHLLAELEARRFRFELHNQVRLEERIAKIEELLNKVDLYLFSTEEGAPRIRGINLSGYGRLVKEAGEAAKQAIEGVREPRGQNGETEDQEPGTSFRGEFVWVKPKPETDNTISGAK